MALLPSARDCMDMTSSGSTYNAYVCLALSQIATALSTAGTYSCTLTMSGKTGSDVQAIKQALLNLGYRITVSGSTITILWDNSAPAVAISY